MTQLTTHDTHDVREPNAWPEHLSGWTFQREQQRDDCLAMLTHDARNRLFVILNYVEILREGARRRGVPGDVVVLESVRANCLALHSLITSSLTVSHVHAVDAAPIDLSVVLERVMQQFAPEAYRRGLGLEYSFTPTLPCVTGDERALERVFANLIHNALKFTPAPGQVMVTARQRAHEVVVSITDTGPGIDVEQAALLTGWAAASPTLVPRGLGLRIVRALVAAHDGRVEVSRGPRAGTCVSVFLRVADDVPSTASE